MFSPASVAVVGASEDPTKWGGSVLRNLIDGGFGNAVYPINPRAETIMGLPAYASPNDLPETPDLVICALGGAAATPVVAECGRRGVPAAIVIAAGFAEAGADGAALQASSRVLRARAASPSSAPTAWASCAPARTSTPSASSPCVPSRDR